MLYRGFFFIYNSDDLQKQKQKNLTRPIKNSFLEKKEEKKPFVLDGW